MKRDYKNQTNNLDQVSSLSWPPLGSVFWALRHRCISLVHVIQHKLQQPERSLAANASRHRRGYRRTDPASGFEISANLISCLKLLENVGKMNQTDSTSTRCRVGVWDHQCTTILQHIKHTKHVGLIIYVSRVDHQLIHFVSWAHHLPSTASFARWQVRFWRPDATHGTLRHTTSSQTDLWWCGRCSTKLH